MLDNQLKASSPLVLPAEVRLPCRLGLRVHAARRAAFGPDLCALSTCTCCPGACANQPCSSSSSSSSKLMCQVHLHDHIWAACVRGPLHAGFALMLQQGVSPLTPSTVQNWMSSLPIDEAVDLVKDAFVSAGERDIYTVRLTGPSSHASCISSEKSKQSRSVATLSHRLYSNQQ